MKNESPIDLYTTANTLLELEFNSYDVHNQFIALDVCENMKTIIDDKDPDLPLFLHLPESSKRKMYIYR